MVTTHSESTPYRTRFTLEGRAAYADASREKGGAGAGFGPHGLLEASVACCINIWLRMYADKHGIPLLGVTAEVRLNREIPNETIFEYAVELQGPLTHDQRLGIHQQIVACPVSRTLQKSISFREMESEDKT